MESNNLRFVLKNMCPMGYSATAKFCRVRLEKEKKTAIFTPNAEMISHAMRHGRALRLLLSADLLFPDGIGAHAAMKAYGFSHYKRTAGIELAEEILRDSAKRGYRVFLLGAKKDIVELAAKKLRLKYKGLNVCGYHHGYFNKRNHENLAVKEKINKSRADIIFVCFGFPLQEAWIRQNLTDLESVKLAIGLGGSLDVWSGKVSRSPQAISKMGLEWLWRTANDPKRLKRIPSLLFFSFFAIKEALFDRQKQYKCYEIDNFSK